MLGIGFIGFWSRLWVVSEDGETSLLLSPKRESNLEPLE